jgi:hypothetical protein
MTEDDNGQHDITSLQTLGLELSPAERARLVETVNLLEKDQPAAEIALAERNSLRLILNPDIIPEINRVVAIATKVIIIQEVASSLNEQISDEEKAGLAKNYSGSYLDLIDHVVNYLATRELSA